jgi:hypothetical protein
VRPQRDRKENESSFGTTLFGVGWLRASGKATPDGIRLGSEK